MKVQLDNGVILEPSSEDVAEQMIENGYAIEYKETATKTKKKSE